MAYGAAMEDLPYPESIFPELSRVLVASVGYSPDLEALREGIEEQEGNAISQAAAASSRVDFSIRALGGYEVRSEGGEYNRPVAAFWGDLWWIKPTFYWGSLERRKRIGELGLEASELDYAQQSRNHLNSVREVYLWLCLSNRNEAILNENVERARTIVENQRKLLEIGRTSQQQVLELEALLDETEEQRAWIARNRSVQRRRLELLVGDVELVDGLSLADIPEFAILSIEEIEELRSSSESNSLESNPLIEREEKYADIDKELYEIARRQRYPNLDLVVGLQSDRIDNVYASDSVFRLSGYAGIQVRWNIFDGRRSTGERMAALARKRAREARIGAAETRIAGDVQQILADIELSIRRISARSTRVEILQKRLALADQASDRDFVAPDDHLELRLDYLQAEQRVNEARVEYLLNVTKLLSIQFPDPISGL